MDVVIGVNHNTCVLEMQKDAPVADPAADRPFAQFEPLAQEVEVEVELDLSAIRGFGIEAIRDHVMVCSVLKIVHV